MPSVYHPVEAAGPRRLWHGGCFFPSHSPTVEEPRCSSEILGQQDNEGAMNASIPATTSPKQGFLARFLTALLRSLAAVAA
jgi:hypothetical protein